MNNLAIKQDIRKNYTNAVGLYEKEIKKDSIVDVESYINLAFLYWIFTIEPMSYSVYYNVSDEMNSICGDRYPVIIDLGLKRYPENMELHFWKRYFSHLLFGEQFTRDECEDILQKFDNTNLVPYFFLYLFDKNKYQNQINNLIIKCEKLPTAKNEYIKSILKK